MRLVVPALFLVALLGPPSIAAAQSFGNDAPSNEISLGVGRLRTHDYGSAQLMGASIAHHFGEYFIMEGAYTYAQVKEPVYAPPPGGITLATVYAVPVRIATQTVPMRTASIAAEVQRSIGRYAPYLGIGTGMYRWDQAGPPVGNRFMTWLGGGARLALTRTYALRGDVRWRDDAARARDVFSMSKYQSAEFQFGVSRRF